MPALGVRSPRRAEREGLASRLHGVYPKSQSADKGRRRRRGAATAPGRGERPGSAHCESFGPGLTFTNAMIEASPLSTMTMALSESLRSVGEITSNAMSAAISAATTP